MLMCVRMGTVVDANGGPVIFENSPNCTDPKSPWHLTRGGYSSATQVPVWTHPAMRAYIERTGSTLVTRPSCGMADALPAIRYYKTYCLNPVALAPRREDRGLLSRPCPMCDAWSLCHSGLADSFVSLRP